MIKKLEISGIHTKLDAKLKAYATEKIGKLDEYLPDHARPSAHAEVKLMTEKIKARQIHRCEVILFLPHEEIVAKATGDTLIAAIDAAEAKLKPMLRKYKGRHGRGRLHHRLIGKIRRR